MPDLFESNGAENGEERCKRWEGVLGLYGLPSLQRNETDQLIELGLPAGGLSIRVSIFSTLVFFGAGASQAVPASPS